MISTAASPISSITSSIFRWPSHSMDE